MNQDLQIIKQVIDLGVQRGLFLNSDEVMSASNAFNNILNYVHTSEAEKLNAATAKNSEVPVK